MRTVKIKGYPNYEICENGEVISYCIYKEGRILKPYLGIRGYYTVNLRVDGKTKNVKIHRLLGLHFIPNPENKLFIDHINRIRTDNRLENLRWATRKENNNNKTSSGPTALKITEGGFYNNNGSYEWKWKEGGKIKSKCMKNLEDLKKYKLARKKYIMEGGEWNDIPVAKKITEGGFTQPEGSYWRWNWMEGSKPKSKCMKNLEDLKKYKLARKKYIMEGGEWTYIPRTKKITEGYINKVENSYKWQWSESGQRKYKQMKNLEDLKKFKAERFALINK